MVYIIYNIYIREYTYVHRALEELFFNNVIQGEKKSRISVQLFQA